MPMPGEIAAPSLALPLKARMAHATALEGYCLIYDVNGRKLATVGPGADAEKRASEMVDACNVRPALTAGLQSIVLQCERSPDPAAGMVKRMAQALIAQIGATYGLPAAGAEGLAPVPPEGRSHAPQSTGHAPDHAGAP